MSNIVFIPNISTGDGRNSSYHYSVRSWQKWAEQYQDVDVIEWTEPLIDPTQMKITLQRYWVHDILATNNIEYTQVLLVDADTIIHPNAPNFFNETEGKFSVVLNNGCYEWVTRSIKGWQSNLFPDQRLVPTWEYFNGGFQITNKSHIPFYKYVQEFYTKNLHKIQVLQEQIKAGTDQTIINFLTQQAGVEVKYLPESYNLQDLFRKNLLHIPNHSWFIDELHYLECGWVYHFNAIPKNPRHVDYWIERTYKELYNE